MINPNDSYHLFFFFIFLVWSSHHQHVRSTHQKVIHEFFWKWLCSSLCCRAQQKELPKENKIRAGNWQHLPIQLETWDVGGVRTSKLGSSFGSDVGSQRVTYTRYVTLWLLGTGMTDWYSACTHQPLTVVHGNIYIFWNEIRQILLLK